MNKDQITKIALMSECFIMDTGQINTDDIDLEVFANLVAAEERENCAKVCDELVLDQYSAKGCAEAIRARGQ
jgi:hypothetical protein